ncbi:MAG: cupin domain-containing protein [Candidatus Roizmanbacteria bacterium]|nr:cupin domain-containing protein [Candidatus Roizmanbacteria bacterium]
MNIQTVVSTLEKKYPGATIIKNPEQDPTEIICEIDPAEKHSAYSTAVAVIDKTPAHVHARTAEIYYVTKGNLTLFIDNTRQIVHEGEYAVIQPGQMHRAEGAETWLEVYSEPGWTKEDHTLTNVTLEPTIDSISSFKLLADNFEKMYNFYSDVLKLPLESGNKTGPYAQFSFGSVKISLLEKKHLFTTLHLQDNVGTSQSCVLTFSVNSVDEMEKLLKNSNVIILSSASDFNEWGVRALHIADPEGNIIELNQDLK